MIKYSLKFKNKTKTNPKTVKNSFRDLHRKDQSNLKQNEAEDFLRFLSQTDFEKNQNYESVCLKEQAFSPWMSQLSEKKLMRKIQRQKRLKHKQKSDNALTTITFNPQNTRYFCNKKEKKLRTLDKGQYIKIKEKCYSSSNDYNDSFIKSGSFIKKKQLNEKNQLHESLQNKVRRKISQNFAQKAMKTQFKEKKWELRESNNECDQIKKKIVQNIQKQSIISMYKMKKPLKSSQNISKPIIKHLRNRKFRKCLLDYDLSNPLTRTLFDKAVFSSLSRK